MDDDMGQDGGRPGRFLRAIYRSDDAARTREAAGEGEATGDTEIFMVVEDMPGFPGGNVQQWISKHVKYPVLAMENGIQGKVYVQFVIEKDGSITDVKVVRGGDSSLDKEAVRVVKSMPKWKPGKQRGKPVRVSFTLPINFQLAN